MAVTVTPVNDAPVVSGIPDITFDEDSSYTMQMDGYVHDVDDSASAMKWDVHLVTEQNRFHLKQFPARSVPKKITVGMMKGLDITDTLVVQVDSLTRRVTFTSTQNFWADDLMFVFTASDPSAATGSDTVHVRVIPVNDPPVLSQLPSLFFAEDDSLIVTDELLESFARDPDDPVATLLWQLNNGSAITSHRVASGFALRGPSDWFGADTIGVIVADPHGLADTASLIIVVTPVNDAPVVSGIPNITFYED